MYDNPYTEPIVLKQKQVGQITPWSFYHQGERPYFPAEVTNDPHNNNHIRVSPPKHQKTKSHKSSSKHHSQIIKPDLDYASEYQIRLDQLHTDINQLVAEKYVLKTFEKYLSAVDKRQKVLNVSLIKPHFQWPAKEKSAQNSSSNSTVCILGPLSKELVPQPSQQLRKRPNVEIKLPQIIKDQNTSSKRAVPLTSFRPLDADKPIHVQPPQNLQTLTPLKNNSNSAHVSKGRRMANVRLVHQKLTIGKIQREPFKHIRLKTIQNQSEAC